MCVIIHKPAGVFLSKKTLSKCWSSNSDGVGIAVPDREKKTAEVIKGVMTLDGVFGLMALLEEKELVVHFRWATHGLSNRSQTHPFPIAKLIQPTDAELNFESDKLIFHNGVLSSFGNKKLSDTADFTQSVLAHLPDKEAMKTILSSFSSEKFILVYEGEIERIGKFEENRGCWFSNLFWDRGKWYGSYSSGTYNASNYHSRQTCSLPNFYRNSDDLDPYSSYGTNGVLNFDDYQREVELEELNSRIDEMLRDESVSREDLQRELAAYEKLLERKE